MVIGLICGCYSSIAVAMPLFSAWKSREKDNMKLTKKYGTAVRLFEFVLPQPAVAAAGAADAAVAVDAAAPAAGAAAGGAGAAGASGKPKASGSGQKWQPKKKKK